MNYARHKKLRADVAEVANTMCDLRARLNDMEHRCRFDSDVLVERLARLEDIPEDQRIESGISSAAAMEIISNVSENR